MSLYAFWLVCLRCLQKCGHDILPANQRIAFDVALYVHGPRGNGYERNAGRGFVGVGLSPKVMIAQHLSVIGCKNDERIVQQAAAL